MAVIFSQPINPQKVPDLQCRVKDALDKDVRPCIPEYLETSFSFTKIYINHEVSNPITTSLKVSLEEFCSRMKSTMWKGHHMIEKMEISEQTPMQHGFKDANYFMDQKHLPEVHNSNKDKNTIGCASHLSNQTLKSAETQEKALNCDGEPSWVMGSPSGDGEPWVPHHSVSDGEHLNLEYRPTKRKNNNIGSRSIKAVACDDCSGIKRIYFGFKSSLEGEKVIILIGNEGSGKTTLVSLAANLLNGIETADDKQVLDTMEQIHEKSRTSMTAYTFCFAEGQTPITIIDTPGLKDITGTEKNIPVQALRTFFTSGSNIQLHAIGYVVSSTAIYLTSSEHHMIDFLIEQYGHGISTNVIKIVTFAETVKNYPDNDIFKSFGIKPKVILKFNNNAFSMKEINDFDRAYWKMGIKSWKRCIKVLKELPPLTIKSLGVKQKQIYSTNLIKLMEEMLKNELKSFILSYKETQSLTQSVQKKSEQVWQSTMALYHLLSLRDCSLSDVESVLVKYVDEVAEDNSLPSKDCVKLLSLCPSRGLLEAGRRVIECWKPIYNEAKTHRLPNTPIGKYPEIVFCKKCKDRCEIQRTENKSKKSDAIMITYKCKSCKCDGSDHVKIRSQRKPEMKWIISTDDCSVHTRNAIENVLQEYSIPGHVLNIRTYLRFVSQNLDDNFNDFIECIVKRC
ncbi:hypothetical protein GWK47_004713 [Chionoecetes opilio]|uniref:G domain-containing protein n=1 Tax=Chionoecetes opilio TaxID=41210 RepID=A0A8J4YRL7_CHIOP|nr:hypothetical protein GWK47_004713 [Chionoecetes opilio]